MLKRCQLSVMECEGAWIYNVKWQFVDRRPDDAHQVKLLSEFYILHFTFENLLLPAHLYGSVSSTNGK